MGVEGQAERAAAVLAPGVHLAVLGADVVLLDTRSDAYLCVPNGSAHLRPLPDGMRLRPTTEAAQALAAAGLLSDIDITPARSRPVRPKRSLEPFPRQPASGLDLWRLGLSVADLLTGYRGLSLGQIVAFVEARQPRLEGRETSGDRRLAQLAAVFHQLAPWLPISPKCLVRSFVLLRFLQRSGVRAQWVFGVTTWPFSAHCWIQASDCVLDDHWERLLVYEPILAVA